MNSRQIEIFNAVMQAGTVTRAAKLLSISQPAVTSSLKLIEAHLGFPLFNRKGGRLHPTLEARILDEQANHIRDSIGIFQRLAVGLKDNLTNHLHVVAPPALSHKIIPDVVASFLGETSSCLLDVTTKHHNEILEDMDRGRGKATLGFTFGASDSDVGCISLGKVKIVALLPKESPLALQESVTIDDLRGIPLIGTVSGEPLGNYVHDLMGKGQADTDFAVRVQNHSMAAELVAKGVGATLIDYATAIYVHDCHKDSPYHIREVTGVPSLPVTAVYSYDHPLNDYAKRFVDLFRMDLNKSSA